MTRLSVHDRTKHTYFHPTPKARKHILTIPRKPYQQENNKCVIRQIYFVTPKLMIKHAINDLSNHILSQSIHMILSIIHSADFARQTFGRRTCKHPAIPSVLLFRRFLPSQPNSKTRIAGKGFVCGGVVGVVGGSTGT
jgi:hypothetical protein